METKEINSNIITEIDGSRFEVFKMETSEEKLFELFKDIYENYWDKIQFGTQVQGAVWEVAAPNAPTRISLLDGYLTVDFGAWHFHICIGENNGTKKFPTPEELKLHRKTSSAEFYRRLSNEGIPSSWGFRCFNGKNEQQATIFFPNPNYDLFPKFKKNNPPKWEKLEMWDTLRKKYLGLEPDDLDRETEFNACGTH